MTLAFKTMLIRYNEEFHSNGIPNCNVKIIQVRVQHSGVPSLISLTVMLCNVYFQVRKHLRTFKKKIEIRFRGHP